MNLSKYGKSLGIPESRIFFYGEKKNWWSNSGTPDQMLAGDIGGPDSEVFEFDVPHDPKFGKECHPKLQLRESFWKSGIRFLSNIKRRPPAYRTFAKKC